MGRMEYWSGMDRRIGEFDRWMADGNTLIRLVGWTGQTGEGGWWNRQTGLDKWLDGQIDDKCNR